jgi:hypothetical protein
MSGATSPNVEIIAPFRARVKPSRYSGVSLVMQSTMSGVADEGQESLARLWSLKADNAKGRKR